MISEALALQSVSHLSVIQWYGPLFFMQPPPGEMGG